MANQTTKVITGKVRLSYAYLFTPTKSNEEAQAKYSTAILIDKKDTKTIEAMKAAIEEAIKLGVGSKFGGKRPANLKLPLRDGDAEFGTEKPEYIGKYFVNASCVTKPGVVDRECNPITDSTEVYSGCYARVSVNFYAFNTNGNRGIACGLNNVQKVADGDSLGGRSLAVDDFGILEDDDLLG